jgi:hypothetical protein
MNVHVGLQPQEGHYNTDDPVSYGIRLLSSLLLQKSIRGDFADGTALLQREKGLCPLAVHQLFSFFDLGLVVANLPGDDFHATGDSLLKCSLGRTFGATLATGGPLDIISGIGLWRQFLEQQKGKGSS